MYFSEVFVALAVTLVSALVDDLFLALVVTLAVAYLLLCWYHSIAPACFCPNC